VIGGHDQKGKYKINARFNKQDLIDRIMKIADMKDKISISNLDGLKFINKMNCKKEEIFIYLTHPIIKKVRIYI